MSSSADFDFSFARPVEVVSVLQALSAHYSMVKNGCIAYLVDLDGLFDWTATRAEFQDEVLIELGKSSWQDRMVGVTIYIKDTERGGDLLFHPGRSVISFAASVNRKNLSKVSKFCDLGWYLKGLVDVFEPMGLREIEARDCL